MEPKGSLQCSHETASSHSHRLLSVCKTRSNMISPPPTAVSFHGVPFLHQSFTSHARRTVLLNACSVAFARQCYDLLHLQWGLFFAFIFFLKRFISQTVYTVRTRINYKIVRWAFGNVGWLYLAFGFK